MKTDVGVMAGWPRHGLETFEQHPPPIARHVVDAPAREDQIEGARRQYVRHRPLPPADAHLARVGQAPSFLEAFDGEIDASDHTAQLSEEDAVSTLSASEIEHVIARSHEPGDLLREVRGTSAEE